MKLEIKKIGNSTGLILPKELLARLKLAQGQYLHVTELPEGGIRLTPFDPDFAEAMKTCTRSLPTMRRAKVE